MAAKPARGGQNLIDKAGTLPPASVLLRQAADDPATVSGSHICSHAGKLIDHELRVLHGDRLDNLLDHIIGVRR
eukprot:CAMPEP_0179170294 /NCGR_PEP_ID=MMETSP0796-20121207/83882_1 /TAXON_ID=73915 /ORGANISM="Pyrodinium bahamense, Strain pbaha01" /LENGTH=73 /DNA_ID=CAMNT_0020873253 /DNA_START=540 /DNA_END=757 /DNA_ORIENTATION=+